MFIDYLSCGMKTGCVSTRQDQALHDDSLRRNSVSFNIAHKCSFDLTGLQLSA